MAKDKEQTDQPLEGQVLSPVYILAYKEGRRLFHTEYTDRQAMIGRIMLLIARRIEFRVEYRDQTEEEKAYYATL